jgi:hypothetical protein
MATLGRMAGATRRTKSLTGRSVARSTTAPGRPAHAGALVNGRRCLAGDAEVALTPPCGVVRPPPTLS